MIKLLKATLLIALLLLISGCENQNLNTPNTPKIDDTLEVVDSTSIRSISDIDSIAFEWKKVEDPRVTGYHFYRANLQEDGTKLRLIKTIKNRYTTHFVDEKLEPNTKYIYKISSATKGKTESRATNDYIVSTLPQMEGVSFIQAISNLPRQIKIIWRPHSNERVKKYIIERSSPTSTKWKKLDTIDGRLQAEYIDDDLKDNEFFRYKLTAITYDSLESLPSEIVKAQTKALPEGVQSLNVSTNLPRKIAISWEASQTQDVIKYNIYKSSNLDSGFELRKSLNSDNLSFEDFINEDGKVYFYKVTSLDKDGLESSLDNNAIMGSTLAKQEKPIITLAQIQGEKVILNWQPGDSRSVSYIVHKTIHINAFQTKTIKIEGINDLRFEDNDIARGLVYSYAIQSVDEFGLLSEITNKTELTLPKLKN